MAPAEQARIDVSGDVWEVGLEHVEPKTGRLTSRNVVPASSLGPSKVTFDSASVLYSKLRPYLNKVLLPDASGVATSEFIPLRPDPARLDRRYLAHYLRSPGFVSFATSTMAGANLPRVSMQRFWRHEISLPVLDEQIIAADILDRADAARAKQRLALARLDDFLAAVFDEMFGDPVTNPQEWPEVALSELAQIGSGVTKGKKNDGHTTVSVPYMRVANVQDGFIDLSEIKSIDVSLTDVAKYALREGDVLLTEGGDPDKLGRGAVWKGEIDPCIHQNHIFRVRTDLTKLSPVFASTVTGSERGKRYFLKSAKQTTGIASINKTQLGRFPMLVPPLSLQERYATVVEAVHQVRTRLAAQGTRLEALYAALADRAFRGELAPAPPEAV